MSRSAAITVRDIGKRYRLGVTFSHDTVRDRIVRAFRGLVPGGQAVGHAQQTILPGHVAGHRARDDFWALRDVGFDIYPGDVVGVIGANGAGKSTLLKILSRITEPTEGEALIRGRVGSLLEVGTGMHPELSGRENVYLNGAILGMTRVEIARKYDEIVAFAGIADFMSTPIKRYSNGMRVRLGFAIAAHLEPEILLVDEVLAVGDAEFRSKCLSKMGEVAGQGRTVLLVSHNMASIEALCTRALFLDHGRIAGSGETTEVVAAYLGSFARDGDATPGLFNRGEGVPGFLRSVTVIGSDAEPLGEVQAGQPLSIKLKMQSEDRVLNVSVGLHIENERGTRVTSLHTAYHPSPVFDVDRRASVVCECDGLYLSAGRYYLTVAVASLGKVIDQVPRCLAFHLVESDVLGSGRYPPAKDGVCVTRGRWHLESE